MRKDCLILNQIFLSISKILFTTKMASMKILNKYLYEKEHYYTNSISALQDIKLFTCLTAVFMAAFVQYTGDFFACGQNIDLQAAKKG